MKSFPILLTIPSWKAYRDRCPKSIPWELIEPHREQAMKNHYQTLERLAQRGGLDPIELKSVLQDVCYPSGCEERKEAIDWLNELLVTTEIKTLGESST